MSLKAEEKKIPAKFSIDTVKDGGLFGRTYPCIVITHPNPPQRYFTDIYLLNDNVVNFYFFGESKANTSRNIAEAEKGTLKGFVRSAFASSNEMPYQQEMFWHRQIFELFKSGVCITSDD